MDKLALAEMTCFPGNNKLVLKEVTKKNVGHSSRTKLSIFAAVAKHCHARHAPETLIKLKIFSNERRRL